MSPSVSSIREVDPELVSEHIRSFAALSDSTVGVTRLGYSRLERLAHRIFTEHMLALGLAVATDAAGNTVAELPPSAPTGLPAIGTGSHLDSVPEGGRFDGIAGVVAAMEVARIVATSGLERRRPWRFVVFAAEEGARFGQACNGSRMIAGLTGSAETRSFSDADGVTMAQAMAECGLDPDAVESARWSADDWFAFVELHIEQGGVLESRGTAIGVVDAISGSTRLSVVVSGQASHTGGTPMHLRKDALVTAASCVLACQEIALDPEHHGTRVTVGRLSVHPGSITTIPGRVEFTVDVRDIDSDRQRRTAEALMEEFQRIAGQGGRGIEISLMGDTSPVVLPAWVAEHIAEAARESELTYRMLPSGASHDSQQINRVTPTGMIFVPSRGGLSHVPEEYTSTRELAEGTRVLLATLKRLDAAQ